VLRHGVDHHTSAKFIPWPDTSRAWANYLRADEVGFLNQFLPSGLQTLPGHAKIPNHHGN
jgi:hypothetical protein